MERDELRAWLRLLLTPGVGSTTARQLLAAFGLTEQVFAQSAAALESVVSHRQTQALLVEPAELDEAVATTWDWLQADPSQRRVLTLGDPSFPQSLLQMEDPPLLLYGMGAASFWASHALATSAQHSVAIVGSRNPTPQGAQNAQQFAHAFAQAGLTVVSGLALGVDGKAHEGALAGAQSNALATVAVVGTGLDRVYPKHHLELARRIVPCGIILSEYPLGTPPLSANFPRRNRLIAGLARGTLVVEAALQSGSLITARLAAEQGKEVFAIPGSIHSTQARGCHALIKQGAKLVECAQDVLEELQTPSTAINSGAVGADAVTAEGTFNTEDPLLQALGYDPVGLDALQARTGLATAALQAQLMTLELLNQVQRLPGGLFQRMAHA